MDLIVHVPMQYCCIPDQTLLSPPDTSTSEHCFPLWLSLFILSDTISNWPPLFTSSILNTFQPGGDHLPVSSFAFSHCSWNFHGRNTVVICYSFLCWTTFCQNSSIWLVCLGWPYTAWLMHSLSYASPFTMIRLWSTKIGKTTRPFSYDLNPL